MFFRSCETPAAIWPRGDGDQVEALLIDAWLGTDDAIAIADEASVSAGRQKAREVARTQEMSAVDGARLTTIASSRITS